MRIQSLRVENLGPIKGATLAPLPPVTLLLGPNEAGKSFLLDALSVLRFGTCRGLKQNENHALTHNGTKGWAVEADVLPRKDAAGPVTLRRTRSTGPDAATLQGAMGDARLWASLLDVRRFLEETPEDRKALVAGLLASDTEVLLDVLTGKGAGPDVLDAVRDGNMKRAFRLAEERRTAVGRAIREAETVAGGAAADDPEVVTKAGTKKVSEVPLTAIDASLVKARAAWTAAIKESGDATRRASLLKAGDEAHAELGKMGGGTPWDGAADVRLADAQRVLDGDRAKLQRLIAERDGASREADALQRQASVEGPCPSCGQPLSADGRAALKKRVAELLAGRLKIQGEADGLALANDVLDKERKELAERKMRWEQERTYRVRLEERIKKAQEVANMVVTVDVAPLEAETRRLEALRETRLRYDGRMESVNTAKGRLEGLRAEYAKAEELSACVQPDKMAGEEEVLQRINEAAAEYGPAVLGGPWVRVTADWEVVYAGMRIELASDSAAIRCGMVLALALGKVSGARCVFVDRLEALDDKSRARVVNLLGSLVAKGDVETAILARVMTERPPAATLPGWLGRFWVEGGGVQAV